MNKINLEIKYERCEGLAVVMNVQVYWDINVVFTGEYLMLFLRSMLPPSPGCVAVNESVWHNIQEDLNLY